MFIPNNRKINLPAIFITCGVIISILTGLTVSHVRAANPSNSDWSRLVYVAENGLYATDLNGKKPVLLVKGKGISGPVFSSDGHAVSFVQNGSLFAYDFDTTKNKLLLKEAAGYCQGQKDSFYASSEKAGLISVNYKTGKSALLIAPKKDTLYNHLALSPDAKKLAFDTTVYGIDNLGKCGTSIYDTISGKSKMIVKATKTDDNDLGTRPSVGKWAPDSNKILVWQMCASASVSADGVSAGIYDLSEGKLTLLDAGGLAYNENISFGPPPTLAMITGGSRMMFEGKSLELLDTGSGHRIKTIQTPGKVPTTPNYSPDGKSLAFAASPAVNPNAEYKEQIKSISHRQIYIYNNGKITSLTSDKNYRSELPIYLKDNKRILFARVSPSREESVWIMDSSGSSQKQLAKWKYSNPEDDRATDFYGRIDWSNMFAVYESMKSDK